MRRCAGLLGCLIEKLRMHGTVRGVKQSSAGDLVRARGRRIGMGAV